MDLETQVYEEAAETPVEEIISEDIEEDVPNENNAEDFAALSTQKYVESNSNDHMGKTNAVSSAELSQASSAPPAPAVRLATSIPKQAVSFSEDEMSDDVYEDEFEEDALPSQHLI